MLVEDWVEFIKNVLSPSAFKDVALVALQIRYNKPVALTDGTGDGGVDAWIEFPSGRAPVQFYAGRAEPWNEKLARELKTHSLLCNRAQMFFVCAQTPEEEEREKKLAVLEAQHNVTITMITARGLAIHAEHPAVLERLIRLLPSGAAQGSQRPRGPAIEARLAFTFFHEKSGDFRAEVARSVLSACLIRANEPIPTEVLLDRAIETAGIDGAVRRAFRRELDTLIDEHKVEKGLTGVAASEAFRAITSGALSIQEMAANALRSDCTRALEGRVHASERRKDAIDDVFDDLGLLIRESLADTLPGRSSDGISRRLNAVERRLAEYLKPSGGNARDLIKALVDVAAASPYGRALATAELFVQLTDRDSSQLAMALTEMESMVVWLDASVALPMLCSKLDRVIEGWASSEIAVELHKALEDRGIKAVLPRVYLEEMAAHLVDAARRYRPLIGIDPDLARSENFYVAHFHAFAKRREVPITLENFDQLLRDLGLPAQWQSLAEEDYFRLRRKIESRLEDYLKRYGVRVQRLRSTTAVNLPDEPARSTIVLQHDRLVVRDMEETAKTSDEGILLCSEDQWLLRVLNEKELIGLHPAVLLDALEIVQPSSKARRLATVRELAATFSEHAMTKGAAVWDMLAELEEPYFSDRDLLRQAQAFKEKWLAQAATEDRPRAKDWLAFKAGQAFGS